MPIRALPAALLLLAGIPVPTLAWSGTDSQTSLLAAYGEALRESIQAQWRRPDSLPAGATCRVLIRQLPGGDVLLAEAMPDCGFDPVGQRSLEAAVLRAQPLPYRGFEPVFEHQIVVRFVAGPD